MSKHWRQTAWRKAMAAISAMMVMAMASGTGAESLGPVTNLPIPRFVSIKTNEANIRRGPSTTHRIDWVFRHQGMPVIVTGEYGHWRRVVDRDGVGGWIHYALLSGTRTVIVDADEVLLRSQPSTNAKVKARAEKGVIARLGDCENDWCEIRADGYRGWVAANALWGLDVNDVRGAPED
ncbi:MULTISPECIES: SH3 domain-containing protein [unclassified Meridianimarinicoccus]|uniref:SH3 domain-containing protein n=1 Tax=unclassified Meridianimarinicoccus TaxID=2923344 RepID=UPI001D01F53A|nr:SH3 domain-containing protein [Fluviibacterium sp. MJW13]